MKVLLFFDSNQIKACSPNDEDIKQLAQIGVDCFTSMYVIDELASQSYRKLKSDRAKVQNIVTDAKYKRFNISFKNITDDEIKKEYFDAKKRLSLIFGSNILDYMKTSEQSFETIKIRNMLKKPPFIDGENNSDKGWNDTLIWLDFCEYCKNSSYDKYYFLTADNGFHNVDQKKELEAEFVKITQKQNSLFIEKFSSCKEIFSRFKCDNKPQSNNKAQEQEIISGNNTESISPNLIERCRKSIENLFYTSNIDDIGHEWSVHNVRILCTVGQDATHRFYELLEEKYDDYLIYDEIDLKEIFDEMGIECESVFTIKKKCYDDFIRCMQEAKENSCLFKSCMSFLMTTINRMFVERLYF